MHVVVAVAREDQVGVQHGEQVARMPDCLPPQREGHGGATADRGEELHADQLGGTAHLTERADSHDRGHAHFVRGRRGIMQHAFVDHVKEPGGGWPEPGRHGDLIGYEHGYTYIGGPACRLRALGPVIESHRSAADLRAAQPDNDPAMFDTLPAAAGLAEALAGLRGASA